MPSSGWSSPISKLHQQWLSHLGRWDIRKGYSSCVASSWVAKAAVVIFMKIFANY